MIKISNGIETKEVTKGVYENIFKSIGYKPVEEKHIEVKKETVEPEKVETVSETPVIEKKNTNKPIKGGKK